MDLMRAIIVGSPGTPYHYGLFVFDVYIPGDFPQTPPEMYYRSHGLRLNPNLYENGRICLSLLNTWSGKASEKWNPNISSILQVLISIQGLVLVAKPYYNEAGYDKHLGTLSGEKNAFLYNESAFLLTLKNMINTMRRPPRHFESLVKDHFTIFAHMIEDAMASYAGGMPV